MNDELQISVSSDEAAAQLHENFSELLARVNGDMMFHSMNPADPVSVEAAIAAAERSIDSHLTEFEGDRPLQALRCEIKQRFRHAIQQQAAIHHR